MGGRQPASPSALASFGGLASMGAGAVAATFAGGHGEHEAALVVFVAVGVLQIAWGGLMVVWGDVRVALAGAVGSVVVGIGWLAATTSGVGFVDGLEEPDGVGYAEVLAGTLTAAAAILAVASVWSPAAPSRPWLVAGVGALTVALVLPGMVQASRVGDAHEPAAAHHDPPAVEAHPFDPTLPIDLGGTPGVTPEQQARAENLLSITLLRLPRFSSTDVAHAAGYRSIGDAPTGEEHYINWSLIDDGRILDPDHPEALVYKVGAGDERTLEAAMFMLPPGSTWDDVPDIGGPLTQWHIHDDLCVTDGPEPKVASVTDVGGPCDPPLVKLLPVPMIHVWITPNACGPFAALRGTGAGQIPEGETRLCDHAHGGH